MGCLRTAASAIATAIYPNILQNELKKYLPRYVSEAALANGLSAEALPELFEAPNTGNFTTVPGITPQIIEAAGYASKRAWARSSKTVFLVTLAFGALMFVVCFFALDVEVYLTDFVPRALQGRKRDESTESELTATPPIVAEGETKLSSSPKTRHIEDGGLTMSA